MIRARRDWSKRAHYISIKHAPYVTWVHCWDTITQSTSSVRARAIYDWRICSFLACVYRVMDARRKFGEHKKCVRVARGAAASLAFWVLSKLPKCIHNSIYAQLKAWANSFITERQLCEEAFYCDREQNSHNAQKKVNKRPYWLVKNTPHFILWFKRELLSQLTDNSEWKAQNLQGKWRKSKLNELKWH